MTKGNNILFSEQDYLRDHRLRNILISEAENQQFKIGNSIRLSDEKAHHLIKVLRLDEGAQVRLVNGSGMSALGVMIKEAGKSVIQLKYVYSLVPKNFTTTLLIGLSKNSTMDWIVEKATEAGVDVIIPLICKRSVVRPDLSALEKYHKRWQKIADEACEQSEREWRVRIDSFLDIKNLNSVKTEDQSSRWLLDSNLRENIKKHAELKQMVRKSILQLCGEVNKNVVGIIGPEGGFEEQEVDLIRGQGFNSILIHDQVLTVEIAVVCFLAQVEAFRSYREGAAP